MRQSSPQPTSQERAPERPIAVPRAAVLANWADVPWTNGCQVNELSEFQPITVVTMNHVYELVVLSGPNGLVRVRGGRAFPEWREVTLAGCSLGGSFLKLRGIYVGFNLELHIQGEVVITSPVQRLTLAKLDFKTPH